ncbi:MAG TPA: FHA domain-containing protein, partial [Polyangiaceae bacterium]|nr:FHA domain-containing protein [Polyangiaceae bacterium]
GMSIPSPLRSVSRYAGRPVTIGLKLHIHDSRTGSTETRVFGHFPVRIGRNPLNDLRLVPGFVSQFHAVLELHGNTLMLRDLGSKNGTTLSTGQAAAHELVDLAESDGKFSISALSFSAAVEDVGEVVPARAPQRGWLLGGLGTDSHSMAETMLLDPSQGVPMGRPSSDSISEKPTDGTPSLRSQIKAYQSSRGTISRVLQTLASELSPMTPEQSQALLGWARDNFPGINEEPEFKRLVEHHRAVVDDREASKQSRLEYVALQAVRELSSLYNPRNSLGTEIDLIQFLTRVRDTLDMFFRTFIPLRDGHRQFKSEMDIRPATPYLDSPAARAAAGVSRAKTPQALAELLLGSADEQMAAQKAIEGTFADLMIHQIALLSGVMRGVHALMQELAPSTVEAQLEERRRKGDTGWMFGPYRFRELWKVFIARHADLTESEKQLYSHVFGHDFIRAYAQLSGEAGSHVPSESDRNRPHEG